MATILMLKAGEQVPDFEPKRYRSSSGYVRLRWYVGAGQIVEVYEHRVVNGVVVDGPVHHVNGVKHDNRPKNLAYCSTDAEHGTHHRSVDRPEIVQLYAAGATMAAIAEQVGVDRGYVCRILSKCGVSARPRQKVDVAKFRELAASGVRSQDIADALGVSYGTVGVWRRRLNFPGKPGPRSPATP